MTTLSEKSGIKYTGLPDHMQSGARRYIELGVAPGDFLTAVLSNDLKEAFGRADPANQAAMSEWVSWLYNECPMSANGSLETVKAWCIAGGLSGRADAH